MTKYRDVLICSYFLIFAAINVFLIPVFEAPDESAHLQYINFISTRLELPNQYVKDKMLNEGQQHPLYYAVCASLPRLMLRDHSVDITPLPNRAHSDFGGDTRLVPTYRNAGRNVFREPSDRNMYYFLRILSAVLAVINVYFVIRTIRLFIKEPIWQMMSAAVVVTLPQFIFTGAVLSNDNIANLLATMTIYYSLELLETPARTGKYIFLGALLGLDALAKQTLLTLFPPSFLALLYLAVKKRGGPVRSLIGPICLFAATFAVSGWYFIRSKLIYGDIFGNEMAIRTVPQLVHRRPLFSTYFLTTFPQGMFASFIGSIGAGALFMPLYVYIFYAVLILASVWGIYLYYKRVRFGDAKVNLALLFLLFNLLGVVWFNMTFFLIQGRYMFPTISVFAVLLALGLKNAFERLKPAFKAERFIYSLISIFFLIDVLVVYLTWQFYYGIGHKVYGTFGYHIISAVLMKYFNMR